MLLLVVSYDHCWVLLLRLVAAQFLLPLLVAAVNCCWLIVAAVCDCFICFMFSVTFIPIWCMIIEQL
jgi:hypothetical protein